MTIRTILAICTICTFIAACSPTLTGSLCNAGPIRPDDGADERWTVGEMDQVIVLNESGERICGWKP